MLPVVGIALVVAFASALAGCRPPEGRKVTEQPAGETIEPTELEKRIFDLVNHERKERDLNPVEWNGELLPPAREHSRRMAELGYFSHDDPEYGSPAQRLRRLRVGYTVVGENLFVMPGFANIAENSVKGWLHSPGHRQVMFDPRFQSSAVGLHRTEEGRVYGTQIFIRRGW